MSVTSLKEPLLARGAGGPLPTNISWISTLTFSWVTPLMKVGYQRPLQEGDVFDLPSKDGCLTLASRLDVRFRKSAPDLLKAIRTEWMGLAIKSGLWKLFNDGAQFAGPIFMSQILTGLTNFSSQTHLAVLALAMYLSQIIGGIGEGQYFQNGMLVGMQLRSCLMGLIFQKSLRLNVHSRMHGVSGGKLTNMIASDTESLQAFCEVMHVLWSAPLRIVTSMIILYYLLGLAALPGAGVLVALIPIQRKLVTLMTARVRRAQAHTDDRLGMIAEAFEGIQLVKCYGWEGAFRAKTNSVRALELGEIKKYSLIRATNSFLISAIPVLVAVVSFTAYSLIPSNPPLSAVQAFTALSLFGVLRFPLMQLPSVVNMLGACKVSLTRIRDFLLLPEFTQQGPTPPVDSNASIILSKATFEHTSADFSKPTFSLKDVSLQLTHGALLVVVGETASGKSSFLQALLGQMPVRSGTMAVIEGPIAYCPQSAWIFNGTVRENVVFGDPHPDEERYMQALSSAALLEDIGAMPNSDKTEIGERGVNLSGGQKQRLSLARAVYAKNSSLVLMDDPLSALDATVASHVFVEAILGQMDGRTRVLVTNRLESVLPHIEGVDGVGFLVLGKDGRIAGQGSYSELRNSAIPEFESLIAKIADSSKSEEKKIRKNPSVEDLLGGSSQGAGSSGKLIVQEDRQIGAVSNKTIKVYIDAMGQFWLIVGAYAGTEIMRVVASVWLSEWSGGAKGGEDVFYFLSIYVAFSAAQLTFLLISQISGALCGNVAAGTLHMQMYDGLIRAPMGFFNATPLGRILNRFSKDVADMDKNLSTMFGMTLTVSMSLVGTLAVLAGTAYYTVIAFVPLLILFYWCQEYYRASSREIKRMDSISRSPIYAHFQQVQDGIATVLAYGKAEYAQTISGKLVDNHIRFNLAQMSCNRWLGVRLEFYGGALVLATALFIVSARDYVSVGIAGLALSTALQVTNALGGIVRLSAMLENSLNSVERIHAYSRVPGEEFFSGSSPPKSWPVRGSINYCSVVARYRPIDPEPVLKSVSFLIDGGAKVGIVGRTGAGKTSLILTLFRIVELESGSISIDGIDISKIAIEALRAMLGIIPQDPIVFAGTVRTNVDPFDRYSDAQVQAALKAAHLTTLALDHAVVPGGKNLSAGQRQQVCLARVVLRRAKILVLDEATSSLDAVTDNLVSETIRTQFASATVITIAHRLHTIVDSDLVIVLDRGRLAESGTPAELVATGGMFASLVNETGPATARFLKDRIAAKRI